MIRPFPSLVGALLVVAAAAVPSPTGAKVLAAGNPSGGFDWPKVEQSSVTRYPCRSTSEAQIQTSAKCEAAWAVKPK